MANELILIKGVKKSFGKREILKGVNLTISAGEKLIIVGKNGSGKSTLINIITGLLPQDEGTVSYVGFKNKKDFLRKSGVQFQENAMPKGFKVKDIVNLMFELNFSHRGHVKRRDWIKNYKKPKMAELLKVFRLEAHINQKVNKLSGGQKQLLNVMLSFVSNPSFIILDEITTGLDISAQELILQYIAKYVKENKATLVVVSHIVNEIMQLGDRIAIIDDGVISVDEKIKDITKRVGSVDQFMKNYFLKGAK